MKYFILFLCVGLSYQICHNGVCDSDKCSEDADCPVGFECDVICGNCNNIPGYCNSHVMCSGYDGTCDVPNDPYTTCAFCDFDTNLCGPGCVDNDNCPDGYQCIGNQCQAVEACTDDAFCNQGLDDPPVCDIQNKPYTSCFYCDGGECKPGCLTSDNCPASYTCSDHICHATPGSVLINSINIFTKKCDGCDSSNEGLAVSLQGQVAVGWLDGLPCNAGSLDHPGVTDFANGISRFTGPGDEEAMGGCYKAPLNGELLGGTLTWTKPGVWEPAFEPSKPTVCVDWDTDTKYAWGCDATRGDSENHWRLVKCNQLVPKVTCNEQ